MPKVDNVEVYGIHESFKASKYPKATDTSILTGEITNTIKNLAQCETGTGHDNFLNGIIVQFDLTFSNKAWVELQRYHFIDFVSSQSSMHKIAVMNIRKMCNKYVDDRIISVLEDLKDKYNETKSKEDYLTLLYNIPSGFELTARMTTNYRQLKTIYRQRRKHRLVDWQMFCDFIEDLPYSELITGKDIQE
jgi:hypothetical protein